MIKSLENKKSFWTSLSGVLTAAAALITAIATLVGVLYELKQPPKNVSEEKVVVPNLVGQQIGKARTQLRNTRLKVGFVEYKLSSTVETGVILSQLPLAGRRVDPGEPISIRVAQAIRTSISPPPVLKISEQQGFAYLAELVDRGKAMISDEENNFYGRDSIGHANATRQVFMAAERAAESISNHYHLALAYLLIAEGYAWAFPELPRPYEELSDDTRKLWFPYKDSMRLLDKALSSAARLKKSDYPNKYGLMGDISFFVALHYDKLKDDVDVIQSDDTYDISSMDVKVRPSRIFYTQALQIMEQAYKSELLSLKSVERKKSGIHGPTAKAYLYKAVIKRFKEKGPESFVLPLILVSPSRHDSLRNMAKDAAEMSKEEFGESNTFSFFFDSHSEVLLQKYWTVKKVMEYFHK